MSLPFAGTAQAFSITTPNIKEVDFIYGKMISRFDTLSGYFWFDHTLTQMGQTVYYKESLSEKKKTKLYAHEFNVFESDSMHLETFDIIHTVTGYIPAMIPRIVNGKIQLFGSRHKGGLFLIMKVEQYFAKKGNQKVRILKRNYKEVLKDLLRENQNLVRKIEEDATSFDDIISLVIAYNSNYGPPELK